MNHRHGGRFRRAIRRVAGPLRDELAESWPVALRLLGLAAIGLAVVAPLLSLRSDRSPTGSVLALQPIPGIGPVVTWTREAFGPAATQAAALANLFPVLAATAWATLGIAVIAMLGRLVAQSYERGPEIGVRRAVGAGRRHILAAQLAEAALLYVATLALAIPAARVMLGMAVKGWPGPAEPARFAAGTPMLIVAAALALGALMPLGHRSARRLVGGDPMPVTLGLPAAQIAAALAVLIAGAALLRHADRPGGASRAAGPGAVWEVDASAAAPEARARAYASLVARLAADSRTEVASLTSRGAHAGLGTVDSDVTDCGFCVRSMIVMRWLNVQATHHTITPDTFTAAGVALVAGRELELTDDWDAPRVAVVNRHLAARYFERGDAVGRDIYLGSAWPALPHRVVGIVDDARTTVLGGAVQPRETVYLSALQHPPAAVELLVRAAGADSPVTAALLRASLGGSARVVPAGSERAHRAADARPLAWFGRWFAVVGVAALGVALFATFDTAGLWVRSVAGELAMRRATGATRRRIVLYVAARAAAAVLVGTLAGSLIFVTLVREYLVRSVTAIPRWDAPLVLACAGLLLAAALAGAAVVLRRLLRTQPAEWLR
jgi:hypothetical protein